MKAARKRRSRGTILTVDVGGSHVKVMTDAGRTKREFSSDPDLSAKAIKKLTKDWSYDVVTVGYPGPVVRNGYDGDWHHFRPAWLLWRSLQWRQLRPLLDADADRADLELRLI
jgi:polyphosphate glucokinase